MNEQLQQEIDNLNVQKQIFTNDLARVAGDDAQKSTYDALQAELAEVDKKIAAKQAQLDEVQTAVATNQADMQASLAQIDVGDGIMRSIYDYTETIEAGNMLIEYINSKIAEITSQAMIQQQAYQQELQEEKERNSTLTTQLYQAQIDLADMTTKRDAAAKELDEANNKVTQAEKETEDLRASIVKPAAPAESFKELLAKAEAAKPKIYNVRQSETAANEYVANLAADGSELSFNWLQKGKYNVISEEEALQFRNEQSAADQAAATTEDEVVQQDSVPDSTLGTTDDLEQPSQPFSDTEAEEVAESANGTGDAAVSTVVAENPVTRAEFEEVKARIAVLEQNQMIGAKVSA